MKYQLGQQSKECPDQRCPDQRCPDQRGVLGLSGEHSKRLIFGSLLCLSPDHFRGKVFFATVTNRDPRKLYRGKIEVMFQEATNLLEHMQHYMIQGMARGG